MNKSQTIYRHEVKEQMETAPKTAELQKPQFNSRKDDSKRAELVLLAIRLRLAQQPE